VCVWTWTGLCCASGTKVSGRRNAVVSRTWVSVRVCYRPPPPTPPFYGVRRRASVVCACIDVFTRRVLFYNKSMVWRVKEKNNKNNNKTERGEKCLPTGRENGFASTPQRPRRDGLQTVDRGKPVRHVYTAVHVSQQHAIARVIPRYTDHRA